MLPGIGGPGFTTGYGASSIFWFLGSQELEMGTLSAVAKQKFINKNNAL